MSLPIDEPNEEEALEELPEDYDTPFSIAPPTRDDDLPADDVHQPGRLDDTHPDTDSNLDYQELYDEGLSGAAESEEPRG